MNTIFTILLNIKDRTMSVELCISQANPMTNIGLRLKNKDS